MNGTDLNNEISESPYKTASSTPGSDKVSKKEVEKCADKSNDINQTPVKVSLGGGNNRGKKRLRKLNLSPEVNIPKRHSQANRRDWKKALSLDNTSVDEIIGVSPVKDGQEEKESEEMEELKKAVNDLTSEWKSAESKREKHIQEWNKLMESIDGKLDAKFESLEAKINLIKTDISGMKEEFKEDMKKLEDKIESEKRERRKSEEEIKRRLEELEKKILEKGSASTTRQEDTRTSWSETEKKTWNDLKWMSEMNEREKKKKNIIVKGLDKEKAASTGDVENWLKEKLDVSVTIRKVWVIKNNSDRPIIGAQVEN